MEHVDGLLKSFSHIYSDANRAGRDLASLYFPEIAKLNRDIKVKSSQYKSIAPKPPWKPSPNIRQQLNTIREDISLLKRERNELVNSTLRTLADQLLNMRPKPVFYKVEEVDKPTYRLKDTPEFYFLQRHISNQIFKYSGLKTPNRHHISVQLRDFLTTDYPLHIIKTDISNFFGSIDRIILLSEIKKIRLLDEISSSFITRLFEEYTLHESKGIPRGVALSSALSELYLKDFDDFIQRDTDLIYYTRYVDDIILIYQGLPNIGISQRIDNIKNILEKLNLSININKTQYFDYIPTTNTSHFQFDYVGYTYERKGTNPLKIDMSIKKRNRYKNRITKSFYLFNKHHKHNRSIRTQIQLLKKRIQFITGNTTLINNKSNSKIGIYFNNPLINTETSLNILDTHLSTHIETIKKTSLKKDLRAFKFYSGFHERVFHRFSTRTIGKIVKAWKYDE